MSNEEPCILCSKEKSSIFSSTYFFAIYDDYPVRRGHALIVPRRHAEQVTQLTYAEFAELHYVIGELVKHLSEKFQADGYNLGVNSGEAGGQTLPHLHIHLIPRYAGDIPDPRGGIRNFLPDPVSVWPVDDNVGEELTLHEHQVLEAVLFYRSVSKVVHPLPEQIQNLLQMAGHVLSVETIMGCFDTLKIEGGEEI